MNQFYNEDTNGIIPDLKNDIAVLEPSSLQNDLRNDYSQFLLSTAVQFKDLMMMYSCAIKEVRTKLEVLNVEYNVRYKRNPINFINQRLKRTISIAQKLEKLNIPFTTENIENCLHDVAGIRVICSFVDDIYVIADALVKQDDIELLEKKDYIASPKPNGYRSLHLIVRVPVFFAEQTKNVKVEVQIRTIAMDFWASLEHQLKYKQDIEGEEAIVKELKECADIISATDNHMLDIRKRIDLNSEKPTPEEELFDKMARFDVPI